MSGGVDSSAAAALLLEQGHECRGITLELNRKTQGAVNNEIADARGVASRLGIPFEVLDRRELFGETVVREFCESYLRGETPNPCVVCNRYVKFEALLRRAEELGYDAVASGHYVRREYDGAAGRWILRKARDLSKDQSYVLYSLTQGQLARCLFPLGELTKRQVREYAAAQGFANAAKRDSQDICFLPEGDYGAFLERYTGAPLTPGDFVDPQGNRLGTHKGTARYTLGQRKGLGLALEQPGYVCEIRPAENIVVVGDPALLFSRELMARELNLIAYERLERPLRCKAKLRYRQTEQWATAEQTGPKELRVVFDEPQRAITPGQAVVLYEDDMIIGGGTIC